MERSGHNLNRSHNVDLKGDTTNHLQAKMTNDIHLQRRMMSEKARSLDAKMTLNVRIAAGSGALGAFVDLFPFAFGFAGQKREFELWESRVGWFSISPSYVISSTDRWNVGLMQRATVR